MPEEAEQIGSLVFVPDPEYPYPFDVPQPPRFWMEEQTGALAEAVETYLRGEPISPAHRDLLRLYLRQYLERAIIADKDSRKRLLARIDKLRTTADVERFADELAEVGVEPF
jgi:hypothetical protein